MLIIMNRPTVWCRLHTEVSSRAFSLYKMDMKNLKNTTIHLVNILSKKLVLDV